MESKCNYQDKNFLYTGNCSKTSIVYKAECMKTGKMYIGQTQNTLKKRINGYLNDVRKRDNSNDKTESFSEYFYDMRKLTIGIVNRKRYEKK